MRDRPEAKVEIGDALGCTRDGGGGSGFAGAGRSRRSYGLDYLSSGLGAPPWHVGSI
jgi:hypothetical protein